MSSELAKRIGKRLTESSDDTVARQLPEAHVEFIAGVVDEELVEIRRLFLWSVAMLVIELGDAYSPPYAQKLQDADKMIRLLDPKGGE